MTWDYLLWSNPDWDTFYAAADELAAPPRVLKNDADHDYGELWWIERAYERIAVDSSCPTCGAQLARRVRAVRASGTSASRALGYVLETRCGSWRRHRYVAMVWIDSGDLVLGRFLTRGSHQLSAGDAS
jgi:hypothetical protein